jgi:hypothetical protein
MLFGFVQVPLAPGECPANKNATATSVQMVDGYIGTLLSLWAESAMHPLCRCSLFARGMGRDSNSEVTISRIWSVNPSWLACGNEPDGDCICLDIPFVTNNMYVGTTEFNKRHPGGVDPRRATEIVRFVPRYRSRGNDDQGIAGVSMPAGASSWLPNIA